MLNSISLEACFVITRVVILVLTHGEASRSRASEGWWWCRVKNGGQFYVAPGAQKQL